MISKSAALAALAAIAASGPANAAVTISTAATQNMTCSGGVCAPTATDATLNVGDLENLLASGNVQVTTTGSGVQADNIDIVSALSWSSAHKLTFDAYQSITVDAPVSVTGQSGLSVVTNDGGSAGVFSFTGHGRVHFTHLKSTLFINGLPYKLRNSVASLAKAISADPSGYYALSGNYDAASDGVYQFSPIWTLYGTLEGLGNEISNLSVNDQENEHDNVALISTVESSGRVSDLSLRHASIHGLSGNCGILAGGNAGTVSSVYVGGRVEARGDGYGGALVGGNSGTIQSSHSSAAVIGGDYGYIGGLVGNSLGTIRQSSATGKVDIKNTEGNTRAGGLVGYNSGTIEQSFAKGVISKLFKSESGALAGSNFGTIDNSYATGSNSGMYDNYSGGLIGTNYGPVTSSYSTGAATGAKYIGGLIGGDFSTNGNIVGTYWDTDTSGITNPSQGAGNIANDPGITGLTTQQLQSGLPRGFDPKIWAENASINNGFPYLINNPPPK
jgi:hypothetical protein